MYEDWFGLMIFSLPDNLGLSEREGGTRRAGAGKFKVKAGKEGKRQSDNYKKALVGG